MNLQVRSLKTNITGECTNYLNGSDRNEKFLELLTDNNVNISSGSYNTVINNPNIQYLLRIMHWKEEYEPNHKSVNYSDVKTGEEKLYNIIDMETNGLQVQSKIYDIYQNLTCQVCDYGTFELTHPFTLKNNNTIKKGVYAILVKYGVSLNEYRNNKLNQEVKKLDVVKWIKENKIISKCLRALKILHHNNYIHGNINADNIVIQEVENHSSLELQCKLIDFAFVKEKNTAIDKTQLYNSPREMRGNLHPDIIDCAFAIPCKKFITPNIDIWALGMTLVKLVFNINPDEDNQFVKTGCTRIYDSMNDSLKNWTLKPDLIEIIKHFKQIIKDKNDVDNINDDVDNINEFIYLLYVIFYVKESNIDNILKCNFFNEIKNEDDKKALSFVESNGIIEPTDFILHNNNIYKSSLYKQPLIVEKKSKHLQQWRKRSVKFTIKNNNPYLLFYNGQKQTVKFNLTDCAVETSVKKPKEISISNRSKRNTLHLRVGNDKAWKNFIENFIKKQINLKSQKGIVLVNVSDCSFLKTCLHENITNTGRYATKTLSWDNCTDSGSAGTQRRVKTGGGRKKTNKGNNKRYLKKTRRRKDKKRKRKTMYKKKLYTRKR